MSGTPVDFQASAPPSVEKPGFFKKPGFSRLCRYLLAAAFLAAALGKIIDLRAFETHVALHANLPAIVEWPVIRILPWLELTCGFCLAVGYARREAAASHAVVFCLRRWSKTRHRGGRRFAIFCSWAADFIKSELDGGRSAQVPFPKILGWPTPR
jgi:hypothetical protein